MKRALITGITGQDGSYLAELLLSKGYEVHGLVRRVAAECEHARLSRISHIRDKLHLHAATLESFASVFSVVNKSQPDELYHLAAQSYVGHSFDDAFSTLRANIDGTLYVLEAVRTIVPRCRVYVAGSSEQYGNAIECPQTEATPFRPRSPYGVSKVAAFDLTRNYAEAHGLFACSGILFNHESPRRGFEFVTRKISSTVAKIKHGNATRLRLGNLDARRDWGFAGDYVQAMWLMLQQERPRSYVVATGLDYSVREFCQIAFSRVGLDWAEYTDSDQLLFRPAEINRLTGDSSQARESLGWAPQTTFGELVHMMVDHDMRCDQSHSQTNGCLAPPSLSSQVPSPA